MRLAARVLFWAVDLYNGSSARWRPTEGLASGIILPFHINRPPGRLGGLRFADPLPTALGPQRPFWFIGRGIVRPRACHPRAVPPHERTGGGMATDAGGSLTIHPSLTHVSQLTPQLTAGSGARIGCEVRDWVAGALTIIISDDDHNDDDNLFHLILVVLVPHPRAGPICRVQSMPKQRAIGVSP